MTTFLDAATDFTDIERLSPHPQRGLTAECPRCRGFGRWNLQVNAYGPGKHFQGGCAQCNGWGYVVPGTLHETCVHDCVEIARPAGNNSGIHVERCRKCGAERSYDTSD